MMRSFTDQLHRNIQVPFPPKRIISLVPSQTELLFHLGLEEEVAGITKFCVHPESMFRTKPRVGGTKKIHFDRIRALQPDLIIANKEENDKEQIEQLIREYPVWISDIYSLTDALQMITSVGALTDREDKADQLAKRIQGEFNTLSDSDWPIRRAAYFIWRKPWMAAGSQTFIDEMLRTAGFSNVFGHLERYPEISAEQLAEARPEVILLSSEPFPFKQQHLDEFREICPDSVILLVDGELFSWYGSRLLQTAVYFRNLRQLIEANHR
jgi:ABC-type Fe3+-hydroxamate transport system substrate-binding protein